jgi:hypothetical protein
VGGEDGGVAGPGGLDAAAGEAEEGGKVECPCARKAWQGRKSLELGNLSLELCG